MSELTIQRRRVKLAAVRRQAGLCVLCGKALNGVGEMHEVKIARRHVMRWPEEERAKIHVIENCVVLHPECHQVAETKTNSAILAKYLDEQHPGWVLPRREGK